MKQFHFQCLVNFVAGARVGGSPPPPQVTCDITNYFRRSLSNSGSKIQPKLRADPGGGAGDETRTSEGFLTDVMLCWFLLRWLLLVSLPSFSAGIWGFPHRLNSTEDLFVAHNALLLLLEAWPRDRLSSATRPRSLPSYSLHLSRINCHYFSSCPSILLMFHPRNIRKSSHVY